MKRVIQLGLFLGVMGSLSWAHAQDYKAGDKVKVLRKGEEYAATVKNYNAAKKCWNIHYDNTSDSWDECVGKKRIK